MAVLFCSYNRFCLRHCQRHTFICSARNALYLIEIFLCQLRYNSTTFCTGYAETTASRQTVPSFFWTPVYIFISDYYNYIDCHRPYVEPRKNPDRCIVSIANLRQKLPLAGQPSYQSLIYTTLRHQCDWGRAGLLTPIPKHKTL